MTKTPQPIPFLWFDHQAEEAAHFYMGVFGNSEIERIARQGDAVLVVDFSLGGQRFNALNSGPKFKFNPSISFFVVCETEAETDTVWQKLMDGGTALMPLDRYDWSEKYGWVQDRFGLSWQISLGKIEEVGQKFSPSFLFTGPQQGQAEAAVRFYTSLFSGSSITGFLHYGPGEEGAEGTLKHAQFQIGGQTFMAMDNPLPADFSFNEAISFVLNCDTQEEVDFFWEKLIAEGGVEDNCGWLKDRFGVSWQIIPEALPRLLSDPDPVIAQRAMTAMLQMRKINIEQLTQPLNMSNATMLKVQTTIQAPIEKIWQCWTDPVHIMQWNNASEDWHTPKAVNDLRPGGKFVFTMAAKDGSMRFDFEGTYDEVIENQRIAYTLADDRNVQADFKTSGGETQITQNFEAENMNAHDMQVAGWQSILDNFKRYVESNG
jgi:predicted 3-demethylubiquinone-9 3-methyltransferase (glyoxalase superfamily)/uncharacterized protein YndB with AHSA1/START domain